MGFFVLGVAHFQAGSYQVDDNPALYVILPILIAVADF
jgi:hypothetical protein